MVKRRKIGLIYQYNENWIGGTYYIQNLIAAVNCQPDNKKPEFFIFTDQPQHFEDLKKLTNYPYLFSRNYIRNLNLFQRALNKIIRIVSKKNIISNHHRDLDVVFPAMFEFLFKPGQTFLYWIPDFQEHYLPQFFSEKDIDERKKYQEGILQYAKYIVFSSESVKLDFNSIYPKNSLLQFVLHFAVTHPSIILNDVIKKYELPTEFFICSNQFWKHKNHTIVIEAVAKLKEQGISVFVVFTGKQSDSRNPDYFDQLQRTAKERNIADHLFFLGFISREDQLCLMKKSVCIIQPSLFEGWSTVIEDAKSLNINIIVSNLEVHKEQLLNYKKNCFFSPSNSSELATCMKSLKSKNEETFRYDYNKDVVAFGNQFLNIIKHILSN